MIGWLLNHVPWWVWAAALAVALAATAPWWTAIWAVTPRPVKIWIGIAGAVAAAYLAGRNRGTADAEAEQRRRQAEAMKTRQEVEDENARLSPGDRARKLDRWMRD